MKNKRIVIIGSYGENNFGDDALMFTLKNYFDLNFPENELLFKVSEKFKPFFEKKQIKTIETNEILKTDVLIYGGGTQFFSFNNENFNLIKLFYVYTFHVVIQFFKRIINSQIIIAIGVGLGPFNRFGHSLEMKLFLKKFKIVFVRDKFSLNFCKNINDVNVEMYPDICYSSYFLNLIDDNKNNILNRSDKKRIGIVVRDWNQAIEGNKYLDNVFNVANELSKNYEVEFFLFGGEKDFFSFEKLKKTNYTYHSWDINKTEINDYFNILSSFDLIITSRFHAAVFANILLLPIICIDIDQKLNLFVSSIKTKNYAYIWKSPFLEKDCLDIVDLIFNDAYDKDFLLNEVNKRITKSDKMFNEITNYINV